MTVTRAAPPDSVPSDIPTEPIWRFTVDDYHKMIGAGMLPSGAPVELLDGWLVKKTTKYPPHRAATRKTRIALEGVIPELEETDLCRGRHLCLLAREFD